MIEEDPPVEYKPLWTRPLRCHCCREDTPHDVSVSLIGTTMNECTICGCYSIEASFLMELPFLDPVEEDE
jgi:hypothetical protein